MLHPGYNDCCPAHFVHGEKVSAARLAGTSMISVRAGSAMSVVIASY